MEIPKFEMHRSLCKGWWEEPDKESLYWYSEYWMHRLYAEGREIAIRLAERNPPRRYMDESGEEKVHGNCQYFYWSPIGANFETLSSISMMSNGFRLFGMSNAETKVFSPVIDIWKCGDGSLELRSAREFQFGDAITFVSNTELENGRFVLGGIYARTEYLKENCNAYLTRNGTLRCLRKIEKGDEIVRWINYDDTTAHLESVDQVVVALDRTGLKLGKVGKEVFSREPGRLVHFSDKSVEVANRIHISVCRSERLIPFKY